MMGQLRWCGDGGSDYMYDGNGDGMVVKENLGNRPQRINYTHIYPIVILTHIAAKNELKRVNGRSFFVRCFIKIYVYIQLNIYTIHMRVARQIHYTHNINIRA